MGSLQDYFKNVLFAGHEFEVSLKGAVDLARDNEDWDRLNAIVAKIEDVLSQAKLEIQKRHPTSRVNYYTKAGVQSANFLSSTLSKQRLDAPVQLSRGFDAGVVAKNYSNGTGLRSQQEMNRLHTQRVEMNRSPTKLNNQAKKKWFDDDFLTVKDGKSVQPKEYDPLGIFLPGLSSRTTENDLRTKFATYGNIRDVRIVKKGPENNPVGKGMIWFDSGDVAQKLVRQTFMVDGAEVKVAPLLKKTNYTRPKPLISQSTHRSNNSSEVLIETLTTRRASQMSDQSIQNNDGKCLVCRSKIDCIVLWCGHSIVCADCAGKMKVCPKCGGDVSKITKLGGK